MLCGFAFRSDYLREWVLADVGDKGVVQCVLPLCWRALGDVDLEAESGLCRVGRASSDFVHPVVGNHEHVEVARLAAAVARAMEAGERVHQRGRGRQLPVEEHVLPRHEHVLEQHHHLLPDRAGRKKGSTT